MAFGGGGGINLDTVEPKLVLSSLNFLKIKS